MHNFAFAVLVPVILGALVISLMGVARRYTFKKTTVSPLQFLIMAYGSATLLFATIYLAQWGTQIPQVLSGFWRAIVCGALANFAIQWFNAKAASLDKGEVSLTAPLQAMTPGLITGLAILLGEYPGKLGVAGIFFMICGSYVLLWTKTPAHWYEYFGPLSRLLLILRWSSLPADERNRAKVVLLSLGSAGMGTIGLLFDGLYTRRGINAQGLILASGTLVGILFACYSLWYFLRPDANPKQKFALAFKKNVAKYFAIFAWLWVLHILLVQPTYRETFVAYTGTLKRFSIIWSVLFGYWFFKEEEIKKRLWAALLIVAGAILISMDGVVGQMTDKIQHFGL